MKKMNFSFANGVVLDLSTANEGLYKMLVNSDDAPRRVQKYIRAETGEWIESTVQHANATDYPGYTTFMSDSNKGKHGSVARMKVRVRGFEQIDFVVGAYAERSYDYVVVFGLDYEPSDWNYSSITSASNPILCHTQGELYQNGPTKKITVRDIDPTKEHFFWVVYRKDSSGNYYDDRGYFAIKLEN